MLVCTTKLGVAGAGETWLGLWDEDEGYLWTVHTQSPKSVGSTCDGSTSKRHRRPFHHSGQAIRVKKIVMFLL